MANTLVTTVNFNQFLDAMRENWESLSYEGATALYEYYNELAEDLGESIEFDPIAIRCEWSEYENLQEFNRDYNSQNPFDYWEEVEENTTVIQHAKGVLVREF